MAMPKNLMRVARPIMTRQFQQEFSIFTDSCMLATQPGMYGDDNLAKIHYSTNCYLNIK